MGTVLDSIDNMLKSAADNGLWSRVFYDHIPVATTLADASSGFTTAQRWPRTITCPSVGTGLTGMYLPWVRLVASSQAISATLMAALEYDFGSIAIGSGTFTDGETMPTKTIRGASVQTATLLPMAVVSSGLSGTAVALTITYTDQAGNTGNTSSPTIPAAAAVNSAFLLNPHLASGDTGMRDITDCTKSGGTGGTISFKGLLPLAFTPQSSLSSAGIPNFDILTSQFPMFKCVENEKIAFYRFGSTGSQGLMACLTGVADN